MDDQGMAMMLHGPLVIDPGHPLVLAAQGALADAGLDSVPTVHLPRGAPLRRRRPPLHSRFLNRVLTTLRRKGPDRFFQGLEDERIKALAFTESPDGQSPVNVRSRSQDKTSGITPVCRQGEGPPLFLIDLDPVVKDPAQLAVDFGFIVAVAAGVYPARNGSDITPILFRPEYELEIFIMRFHFCASSIFILTNLS